MSHNSTAEARTALEGAYDLIIELQPRLDELRTEVTLKGDDTPVTAADKLVQNQVEEYLRGRLDDLTFVGEEDEAGWHEEPTGWVAVVDPIDGTENFASSLPEWGTAVAIFKDGEHAASMIALPELGKRLITGDEVSYRQSRITAFSSGISEELVRQISETPQSRLFGAAVYNLYNVVTGRLAQFVNPVGAFSWDLLAGLQLALEHGCKVTVDGKDYTGWYLDPGVKYAVDIRRP
ncbi:inositol monophosphatase family protein [Nesterenkonia sp. MY13]|uniref:Inositol monophosphatase family protein n=1 Tax=Nesterenkonia sedimenti TaxID=1463632 RepID=A0A7X8TLP1_9MICC|nr:inositol monophosphatase family protein [Nesterenkonia sedimenti]NLS11075.1 inositol monophosphatase family protein [Nesterenkonia sedimenti]